LDIPIRLHTEIVIDSAHFLKNYTGKCSQIHGHSWRIRVWVKGQSSQLDELGILYDFTDISYLKDMYDHKLLNECDPFIKVNPTAENMAISIYNHLKNSYSKLDFVVRVYENSINKETWAEAGD